MAMPKPTVNVINNLQDRKGIVDAAIENEGVPDATPRAKVTVGAPKPAPKTEPVGMPKPSLMKRIKSMVTGTNPYLDE